MRSDKPWGYKSLVTLAIMCAALFAVLLPMQPTGIVDHDQEVSALNAGLSAVDAVTAPAALFVADEVTANAMYSMNTIDDNFAQATEPERVSSSCPPDSGSGIQALGVVRMGSMPPRPSAGYNVLKMPNLRKA